MGVAANVGIKRRDQNALDVDGIRDRSVRLAQVAAQASRPLKPILEDRPQIAQLDRAEVDEVAAGLQLWRGRRR